MIGRHIISSNIMGVIADTFRHLPDFLTGDEIFQVSSWRKNADKVSQGFHYLIDNRVVHR